MALTSIFSSEDPLAEIDQAFSTLEASEGDPITALSTALPDATPAPGAAELVLSFGSEGIAPGQFNDARTLSVAPDGTIYVADRDSGRLQIFNAEGQVQDQWQMDQEKFIDASAIDRAGYLYTLESSDIYRYDLATGERLNQITYPGPIVIFSGIATTVDNQLVAVDRVNNQVIRFDPEGNPGLVINVENIPDATGFEHVAVDGSGNIYVLGVGEDVLGDRQETVFKFNPEGQFVTRFGQTGSEPGTFRAPNTIAVDGRGRVFVGDIFGIHIFDNNGGFIDYFAVDGAVFDMKFNDQGELIVTNRDTIFIYKINI